MTQGNWFIVRVELVAGPIERIAPPPGRDFLVASHHSLQELAGAIDAAFARWDLGHLHLFRMPGGEGYLSGGDEEGDASTSTDSVFLGSLGLTKGSVFEYVFDLGDEWVHRCEVRAAGVDADAEFGDVPPGPVPLFGWGPIPDQYGRTVPDDG